MKEFLPNKNTNLEVLALENEELKSLLVREKEYNTTLDKVKHIQQIIKLSESLSDVASTVQQRNFMNTTKLVNFARLEKENKDLRDQIQNLTEKVEYLTTELKSKKTTQVNNFSRLEGKINELTAERNALKNDSAMIQKTSKSRILQKNTNIQGYFLYIVLKNKQDKIVSEIFNN